MPPPRLYPVGDPYYPSAYTTVRDYSDYRPARGPRRPDRYNNYPRPTFFTGPRLPYRNNYPPQYDYPPPGAYSYHVPAPQPFGYILWVPSPSPFHTGQSPPQASNQGIVGCPWPATPDRALTTINTPPPPIRSTATNRINRVNDVTEDMLSLTISAQLDRAVTRNEQYFDDTIYKLKKALVQCRSAFANTKTAFEEEQLCSIWHTQHDLDGINAVNTVWQSRCRAGSLHQSSHALDGSAVLAAKFKDVRDTNEARQKLKKALELVQKSTPYVSEARKYNGVQARNRPAIASALADLKTAVANDLGKLERSERSWLEFKSLCTRIGELMARVDEWEDFHGDLGVAPATPTPPSGTGRNTGVM